MTKMKDFLHSRRDFIGIFAAAIPLLSVSKIEPQSILYNANIFTINPNEPMAQALAIADGRLMAVGSNKEILRLANGKTN